MIPPADRRQCWPRRPPRCRHGPRVASASDLRKNATCVVSLYRRPARRASSRRDRARSRESTSSMRRRLCTTSAAQINKHERERRLGDDERCVGRERRVRRAGGRASAVAQRWPRAADSSRARPARDRRASVVPNESSDREPEHAHVEPIGLRRRQQTVRRDAQNRGFASSWRSTRCPPLRRPAQASPLSTSSWLTSRPRDAPSAWRSTTSRSRSAIA